MAIVAAIRDYYSTSEARERLKLIKLEDPRVKMQMEIPGARTDATDYRTTPNWITFQAAAYQGEIGIRVKWTKKEVDSYLDSSMDWFSLESNKTAKGSQVDQRQRLQQQAQAAGATVQFNQPEVSEYVPEANDKEKAINNYKRKLENLIKRFKLENGDYWGVGDLDIETAKKIMEEMKKFIGNDPKVKEELKKLASNELEKLYAVMEIPSRPGDTAGLPRYVHFSTVNLAELDSPELGLKISWYGEKLADSRSLRNRKIADVYSLESDYSERTA